MFQTLFHWLVIIPIPHPLSICFRRFYFDNALKISNENDFLLSGQSGWKCWPHGVWPLICNGIPKLSFPSRISWHGVARVHVHPNVKENQKIHLDCTNTFVNYIKVVKTWGLPGDLKWSTDSSSHFYAFQRQFKATSLSKPWSSSF